ncbi:hypothetical protein KAFR_0H02330 [Kazachstania africana CBS 2517]|uniref:DNA polymerase n=1 Tax=Kazachstania africana (strain ATCC 22294 / BCRC 22015 / CBS 2517 / CECT 1963 / NBRC 1671 / NRRL Y-8276) TaxID=1071382 RepID=H2AZ86_KAZAF|nr:hypothetical protein KAFR_0H02330 [Kazachstania africana CBS 2517]CCF59642.1 hypothetical protein KAFR_0H02330 [Kazachstania africana CBS 2517]
MSSVNSSINSSSLAPDLIHVQMNNYDFYMNRPTILDRKHGDSLPMSQFNFVPSIRVYGFLPTGHQVLCHIHGVFPYIFVKYDGNESDSLTEISQKCTNLHLLLERKMTELVKKKGRGNKPTVNEVGNDIEHIRGLNYIANVSLIKGIPFYGFNMGYTLFYKITLLNPSYSNRLSDLIRDKAIFATARETFESHIPYLLQFSMDFNLFGCSWIHLNNCYFRDPILNSILDIDDLMRNEELDTFLTHFCDKERNVLDEKAFPRMGNGLLEIDILPQNIKNIDELYFRDIHHDFIEKKGEALHLLKQPYVSSTKQMVNNVLSQRALLSLREYVPQEGLQRLKDIKDFSHSFKDFYDAASAKTTSKENPNPTFDTYLKKNPIFEKIRKPYEAINELWPEQPNTLNSQTISENENEVIDTSFQQYTILDDEGDAANNMNEDYGMLSQDSGFIATDTEDDPEKHVTKPRANVASSNSAFSLDTQMTQLISKRKRLEQAQRSNILQLNQAKQIKLELPYGISKGERAFFYKKPPFNFSSAIKDLTSKGYPEVDYTDPYFGEPTDLELKPYIYAGKRFEINSPHLSHRIPLPFHNEPVLLETEGPISLFSSWKYLPKPPTYYEVHDDEVSKRKKMKDHSQIGKATQKNDFFYKYGSRATVPKKISTMQDKLTHFSLEIHVNTRDDLKPDPLHDQVSIIFWKIDDESYPFDFGVSSEGIMVLHDEREDGTLSKMLQDAAGSVPVAFYESEFMMFDALTDLVLLFDPDILSGYEVHLSSWGYIIERCIKVHKFNIIEEISRVISKGKNSSYDFWGYTHSTGITVTGRHILNIWRILSSDLQLTQYTVENIAYNLLHKRLPHFSNRNLTEFWNNKRSFSKIKTVLQYWLTRVRINFELLKAQDFIARTMVQARLIGVDFQSVYYRGSQYRVESFLVRVCKGESFILVSPSKQKVREQKPLECVPLIMEPESAFYKSPMLVLDFQSLYPSIMIAYNYCYSTLLGRVREMQLGDNEVGVSSVPIKENTLRLLKDDVTIAPNGLVFVNSSIRKSTLAKMLADVLDIRVMVKKTISELGSENDTLRNLLNNEQEALKLLANVTYGYTSASFSGRMPCSDLADSIVQTGRETLERAIELIESDENWGAKVVYGDTDSLFIYLPGKTREEAFTIGNEMSIAVSASNPEPLFLKFEKVYHPCILVSKKRYVGYSYEKSTQQEPKFDSKGIETVRRDGHPAQQKIVEKSLKILFDTKDITKVKEYVQDQFFKIHSGKVSIQDFCFAKAVKLGTYKSAASLPPGAMVAMKQMKKDTRAEPQYKERVPYLIVKGSPGQVLRERSISPEEFFANPNLELDATYYIDKTLVPPLSRLFNIIGINVADWAFDIPRMKRDLSVNTNTKESKLGESSMCINCGEEVVSSENKTLCGDCEMSAQKTTVGLLYDTLYRQNMMKNLNMVCRTCTYQYTKNAGVEGDLIASKCDSYDCPIYYSRIKSKKYLMSDITRKKRSALDALDNW